MMINFHKKRLFHPAVLICLLFTISPTAYANATAHTVIENNPHQNFLFAETYLQKAKTLKLAEHITWRRLLHYPDTPNKQTRSQISEPSFFVAKNGNTDPHAEMVAMLEQLFSETPNTANSVQCRFPARTHWLKQQLNLADSDLPAVDCSETNAWLDKVNPDTAWLIFAEEYLDSPASAFGHSFLRLDNAKTGQNYILNYEPKITHGESFLKFSYKSTLAGIEGVFSVVPYEEKIQQYRDKEGRDIWRYQLNLSPEELKQLARQIWEIKDQHPTYLLASDNCASEILLLLNALRPDKNYLQDFNKLIAPADIVRALDKQGVLKQAMYEPSLKSQQQAKLNAQKFGQNFTDFSANSPLIPNENNPQTASPLSVASIGLGQENGNTFAQIGYRGVYHDSLDQRSGYPAGYYLEALSAKIRLFDSTDNNEQHARLEEATLIKSRSLNPINTAESQKPWGGRSWGGQIGLTQVSDGFGDPDKQPHNRHLVANLGAEYGWSMAYGLPKLAENSVTTQIPPNICYALGTGNAQFGKGLAKGYRIGVGATLGCIQQFNDKLRGTLSFDLPYWYQAHGGDDLPNIKNRNGYWQPQANLGVQYDLNRHHALRLNGSYSWQPNQLKNETAGQLAYLYYF